MLELLTYAEPSQDLDDLQSVTIRRNSQDDAILEEARMRLASRGFGELCGIECEFEDGKLTLRGRLSSFHLKQLAQESLRQLRGAKKIVNSTEVTSNFDT